jgi:RNA polymerase sigma-70 factor (ECF subfamily)
MGPGQPERELIEAAQGDPSRFAEIYDIYFDRVYAFIARRVRDRSEAEDLTSETFHQALAHLPRFEWRGAPFGAWLLRIAANAVSDHWRRLERERGLPCPPAAADPPQDDSEELAAVFRSMRELPEDQRRVVEMRFLGEKSIREIAQHLGRSEGAVKQLQFRALENLRAQLGDIHG